MITDTLAEPVRKRIAKRLQSLHKNPRPQGAKKLTGEDGLYRIREGDHRIIYTIRNKEPIVLVVKIGDWEGSVPFTNKPNVSRTVSWRVIQNSFTTQMERWMPATCELHQDSWHPSTAHSEHSSP